MSPTAHTLARHAELACDHRRLIVRRLPYFAAAWLGLGLVWRLVLVLGTGLPATPAALSLAVQGAVLGGTIWICRRDPAAPHVPWVTVGACLLLESIAPGLVVLTGGQGEVLAFNLFLLCLSAALVFAWGWRPTAVLLGGVLVLLPLAAPSLSFFLRPLELLMGLGISSVLLVATAEMSARSFRTSWHRRRAERQATRELAESRDAYRDLAENASDLIYTHDLAARLTYVNKAFAQYVGAPAAALIGRSILAVVDTEQPQADVRAGLKRVAAGETVAPLTLAITTERGKRWLECAVSGMRDVAGRVVGVRGIGRDVTERTEAERLLDERARIWALVADAAVAMTESDTLRGSLQRCAEALVQHLDAAFARIWTADPEGRVLELQASAGLYTHLDGAHSRVAIGTLKIGLIAEQRVPHLTNAVVGDPRIHDQEWARREGMVAFAGYPLLLDDRLIGVMALFARRPLAEAVLTALASVARVLAIGIERKRAEEALHASYERIRRDTETLHRLARHQSSIREEERKRLGLDLHDGVSQDVLAVGIHLELLRQQLEPLPADVVAKFERIRHYLEDVVEHLRVLAHDLRPMVLLDLGLEESLRALLSGMSAPGVRVVPRFPTAVPALDEDLEIGVYRIAQEALANATRHAQAGTIVLTLAVAGPTLRLEVRDDGCGFVPAERRGPEMFGLVGMEQRALALGGRLGVRSAPQQGTSILLECPLVLRSSSAA